MIVNGKKIAQDIFNDIENAVRESSERPHLTVITCAPNFETKKYLALKEKKAATVGVVMSIVELSETATTEEVVQEIEGVIPETSGIIVQLPLPSQIDSETVLRAVPPSHDVDALNPETTTILPAVVGAFKEILERHSVGINGKLVTVLGAGRLVGLPAAKWFEAEGAAVSIVTRDTLDITQYTKNADIIVCGAGDPGFLKPDMVKEGVVILDAGTSEEGGVLKGDADPASAEKAALFTPVPGGIGPITVAILLRNLIELTRK